MKINLVLLGIIIFTIIGCVSQAPAPIEYNYDKNYTQNSLLENSRDNNQNDSNEKTSRYGEDEIISKPIMDKDLTLPSGVVKDSSLEEPSHYDDTVIIVPKVKQEGYVSKMSDDDDQISPVPPSSINASSKEEDTNELNSLLALSDLQPIQKTTINNELLTPNSLSKVTTPTNVNNAQENPNLQEQTNTTTTIPKFIQPVEGKIITKFGDSISGGKSKGINIIANEGENVYAVAAGKVIFAGENSKFGNLLIIKLDEGELYVAYAHLNKLILAKNDIVAQGDVIGYVGHTGDVSSPQLYFAINEGKLTVDPLKYIRLPHL